MLSTLTLAAAMNNQLILIKNSDMTPSRIRVQLALCATALAAKAALKQMLCANDIRENMLDTLPRASPVTMYVKQPAAAQLSSSNSTLQRSDSGKEPAMSGNTVKQNSLANVVFCIIGIGILVQATGFFYHLYRYIVE